jgi:hypothetical protein
MMKDTYIFDDFDEWVFEAHRCGAGVWDRTHDTPHPTGESYFAMAWEGEIGEFNRVANTGHITV